MMYNIKKPELIKEIMEVKINLLTTEGIKELIINDFNSSESTLTVDRNIDKTEHTIKLVGYPSINMELKTKSPEELFNTLRKERDAAIADLTELCMFYKTQTICNFCAYDSDEDCKGRGGDNGYMNKCFKWRGPT